MIKPGIIQKLKIVNKVDFGVYLSDSPDEKVLLPIKQVPPDAAVGDELEVFVYLDSKDRKIATVNKPLITIGELAVLTVKEVTKMGAFLDMGLERDLLLPFREQTYTPNVSDGVLVKMYLDKTGRLAASMKVYSSLIMEAPYAKDDEVDGLIYEISRKFGAFVAVDYKYSALIPAKELPPSLKPGDRVHARVSAVKEDGRLDLSVHKKAYIQMDEDADALMAMIRENNGSLGFNEKSEPWFIKEKTGMSKAAFKRAVGHLFKQRLVELTETDVVEAKAAAAPKSRRR